MEFSNDFENWQLMSIISVISFLFLLSNKIGDETYFVEIYYSHNLSRMISEVMTHNVLFDYIFINFLVLLSLSVILMSYFTICENIYLYSIYSFLFSLIVLFNIVQASSEFTNLGIGFYLLLNSYIFTIFSLYYSLSKIYSNHTLENINKFIHNKNITVLFLSMWFVFIFNVILLILSHIEL